MFKKYKYLLVLIAVILLLPSLWPILALEINYPTLDFFGVSYQISPDSLVSYIQYFFVFAIMTAGIVGVISIVISGVLILINAGNPTAISAARERLFDAILGIILLLFSFIILRTINPVLVNPVQTIESLGPGVYLYRAVPVDATHPQGYEYVTAPVSQAHNDLSIYEGLYYKCNPPGKTLLLWVYDAPNFEINISHNGNPFVNTYYLKCGDPVNTIPFENPPGTTSIFSFKMAYDDVGIYYYIRSDCTGISSSVQKEPNIIPYYDRTDNYYPTRSVRIVSGTATNKRYGVILSKLNNLNGECGPPIIKFTPTNPNQPLNASGNGCFTLIPPSAPQVFDPEYTYAFIFRQNPKSNYSDLNKVELYSEHYQVNIPKNIIGDQYTTGNPDLLLKNGINGTPAVIYNDQTPIPPNPPGECQNLNLPCLKDIRHVGAFYTVLYTYNNVDLDTACTVLDNGVTDLLSSTPILYGDRQVYRMDIIPTPSD